MSLSPTGALARPLPLPRLRGGAGRLLPGLPGLVALAVGLWRLDGPPIWRDEAATISAVTRTPSEMLDLLARVDAVHSAYYALMHVVVGLFGTGDVALRLPSVLGGVLAASGLAVLGRSLGNPRAGLYGGLLLAVMPIFSRYVQEGRPYGITMAGTVGVTLLLVRAVRAPSWRCFLLYGTALAGLAYLNLFAFLVAGGHGVYVLAEAWRGRRRSALPDARGVIGRWLGAAALALAAVLPLAWFSSEQSAQVGWIRPPAPEDLRLLAIGIFGDVGVTDSAWPGIAPLVLLLALYGLTRCGAIARLALPWLLVAPLTLLAVSWAVHPLFVFRYVLCCVPAAALLAGAGLAALPRRFAVPLLAAGIALAVPGHLTTRGPDGRQDNPDPLMAVLKSAARPGDAVAFAPGLARKYTLVYPGIFDRLDDVLLRRSPEHDGSFSGQDVGRRAQAARLDGVGTLWVVGYATKMQATGWGDDLFPASFECTGHWVSGGLAVARFRNQDSSNEFGVG
ncbi:glycosyltransferase family 39 protein [Microtetraspora sp. NBRC 16547]|uniref:glycosyltransferase family 39 protein n=1 Tax=Microtetraspora sp. NBRC 16547 TaxID=3030993 RepID=UPI0024A5FC4E|nr:glycosyltransferase family 39 protein [Microtetraspora sp. NBRC 16547]GLW96239.1 membrane protein [Microtetraspora sp. NBRC 16547]